jgi:predicted kinase
MKSLSLSKPHLIVMVGVPGAGKSFFSDHFADTFSAPIVSWNAIRSDLFNEPTHAKEEDEIVGRVASALLEQLLKTGVTVLYEGGTHTRVSRQALAKQAAKAGYETLFVWVQVDTPTAKSRAKKQGISSEVFDQHTRAFTSLAESEPFIVISGKHTYPTQLKIVLKRLSAPRVAAAAQSEPPRRAPERRERSIPIQ